MLGRQRPFSPSVPAEAGCLLTVAAVVHVFISVESLHCFLIGWCKNKSYVIATSDLWLFIHASNLLPLNSPSPLPYNYIIIIKMANVQSAPELRKSLPQNSLWWLITFHTFSKACECGLSVPDDVNSDTVCKLIVLP